MIPGSGISWRRLLNVWLAVTGIFLASASAEPSGASFSADAVKAAYLINFIRFTEWPASALGDDDAPFIIGVAGNRDLEDYLWKITDGKTLHGHKVRVLRLVTLADATACQLIYINPSPSRTETVPVATEEWLRAVRGKPVLTVSNEPAFLKSGGIINFFTDGNNLRFEISPDAAASSSLQLSSRLLALARIVHTAPPAPDPTP